MFVGQGARRVRDLFGILFSFHKQFFCSEENGFFSSNSFYTIEYIIHS